VLPLTLIDVPPTHSFVRMDVARMPYVQIRSIGEFRARVILITYCNSYTLCHGSHMSDNDFQLAPR
jgi:hypothetical protein